MEKIYRVMVEENGKMPKELRSFETKEEALNEIEGLARTFSGDTQSYCNLNDELFSIEGDQSFIGLADFDGEGLYEVSTDDVYLECKKDLKELKKSYPSIVINPSFRLNKQKTEYKLLKYYPVYLKGWESFSYDQKRYFID